VAREIHALCEELELPAYVKTSGASGLHVLIPLGGQLSHDQSRTLAELLARVMVDRQPGMATIARSVRARRGRVYLDYLQNGHGKLLVAPFSVRAEVAGSVSMPLEWTEVNGRLANERFHLRNAVRRMRRLAAEPLVNVLTDAPDLPRSLARLQQVMGRARG
jgi:bifunctional non-homologous end joining protein LigD